MWTWTVSEAKALATQANITEEIIKDTAKKTSIFKNFLSQDLRIEIKEKFLACRAYEVQKIKKKLRKINDHQGDSMLAEGDKKKRKDMKDTSTKYVECLICRQLLYISAVNYNFKLVVLISNSYRHHYKSFGHHEIMKERKKPEYWPFCKILYK